MLQQIEFADSRIIRLYLEPLEGRQKWIFENLRARTELAGTQWEEIDKA